MHVSQNGPILHYRHFLAPMMIHHNPGFSAEVLPRDGPPGDGAPHFVLMLEVQRYLEISCPWKLWENRGYDMCMYIYIYTYTYTMLGTLYWKWMSEWMEQFDLLEKCTISESWWIFYVLFFTLYVWFRPDVQMEKHAKRCHKLVVASS